MFGKSRFCSHRHLSPLGVSDFHKNALFSANFVQLDRDHSSSDLPTVGFFQVILFFDLNLTLIIVLAINFCKKFYFDRQIVIYTGVCNIGVFSVGLFAANPVKCSEINNFAMKAKKSRIPFLNFLFNRFRYCSINGEKRVASLIANSHQDSIFGHLGKIRIELGKV